MLIRMPYREYGRKWGFTLLEVLLVVAVLAVVGAAGGAYYRNIGSTVQVKTAGKTIAATLKMARVRAMTGESERRWGVHFVNGSQDYYELFSTPTTYADPSTAVEDTVYLPGGITFTDPLESASEDIIFSRVSGTSTPATIGIASQIETTTVSVSSVGAIY